MKAKEVLGPIYNEIGFIYDDTNCCPRTITYDPDQNSYFLMNNEDDPSIIIHEEDEVKIDKDGDLIIYYEDQFIALMLYQTEHIDLNKI